MEICEAKLLKSIERELNVFQNGLSDKIENNSKTSKSNAMIDINNFLGVNIPDYKTGNAFGGFEALQAEGAELKTLLKKLQYNKSMVYSI